VPTLTFADKAPIWLFAAIPGAEAPKDQSCENPSQSSRIGAPASSMDGVQLPSSCDSKRATRKRASGFTGQPLKMSLNACAKVLAKPRMRRLELKFSVSSDRRGYCTALGTLVRRMKTRRARIAKIPSTKRTIVGGAWEPRALGTSRRFSGGARLCPSKLIQLTFGPRSSAF
jgi:hypothetical protein